jgi:hypothetical protein
VTPWQKKKFFFIFAAVGMACAPAAPPPGSAGPAEAVQALADALRKGDAAMAWSLISSRAQAASDAQAGALRAFTDAGPESGRQMLFSSAIPGRAVTAKTVSQNGDTAEVSTSAEDGGDGRTYRVVREGGRWRVDLDLSR